MKIFGMQCHILQLENAGKRVELGEDFRQTLRNEVKFIYGQSVVI